jgi:SAM-dependent methyltransferase
LRLAEARGVRIDYRVADLETFDIPSGALDAIVLTFVHLPAGVRRAFHRRLVTGLAPGGVLILEAFTPEHQTFQEVNPHAGGPRDPALLFTAADLREDFEGLECLRLEECTLELAEGPHHRGSAAVVRYIGRKPVGG